MKRWERRDLAINLRKIGLSYGEIAELIPTSRGTLSAWCSDIRLTSQQQARLDALRPTLAARVAVGRVRRDRAIERRERIRNEAKREATGLLWSEVTNVPETSFTKTFVKREGTGHRKRLLYNGTASVRLRRSGEALQRVLGWIDAVSETWAASSIG